MSGVLNASYVDVESTADNTTAPLQLQPVNNTFVIDIVHRINELYQFKNFVFYISERLSLNTEGALDFFRNFWLTFPTAPNVILRHGYNDSVPMAEFISTPSLVIIYTTERDDPIMEFASSSLRGLRWLKTIFILIPFLGTSEFYADFETHTQFGSLIKTTYEWVWRQQFINTLLLTIKDNVYIQNPYPTPTVINKTGDWRAEEFFQVYWTDMQGYVVRSPIMYDMPRVFKSYRTSNSYEQSFVRGTSGNLFLAFLESVNATLVDTSANYSMNFLNLEFFLNLVSQGVYETLVHSFTAMGIHAIDQSYPIGINDWCFMVPYRNQSPEHLYMRDALQRSSWILIFFTVIYMSFAIWWCSPLRPRDLGAAFLQSICSLTNATPLAVLKSQSLRMRTLFVLFFVMGLVTSTMYISKMASYFTSAPSRRQLNSVQDIIDANLKLKVLDFEYEHMLRFPKQFTSRFLQQVEIVEKRDFDIYRDTLNASHGYSVTSDRWVFLDQQQQHLRKPLFRLTNICSGPFYHVYPISRDSHLRSPLQGFIMIVMQSGIMDHWSSEAFLEALHLGYLHMAIVNDQPKPLSLSFFSSIVRTWCVGLLLAGLAFALEMKWYQIVTTKLRLQPRKKSRSFLRRFIRL
ncbi:uncharacterized protein LOC115634320 [Scaptodrosophila lebanonensis]|uniref:Uncharacterized protein LOC115634320 n=1 Tax=Drosophila lebanonensis TaxID=7225 RepID=A0A6J2UK30_DROLE|nr:uncharacterized protein LOC115634320 [Scaptodrosophila lebanonensis]